MYRQHTKVHKETKISWAHRGKLVLWTKSSWSRHVSKNKHHLRLTTHADVASFDMAVKLTCHTDRMPKNRTLKHKVFSGLFHA